MRARNWAERKAIDALESRYSGTAYVVLPQVANATGFGAGRWVDAVVASLWPSRGLWLHGFEVKSSRSDWLRELKRAEKADALCQQLDYFSILVTGPKIVLPGELPQKWGLVSCHGKGVKTITAAPPLHEPVRPAIEKEFVMALLRGFDKVRAEQHLVDTTSAIRKAAYEHGLQVGAERAKADRDEDGQRLDFVREFKAALAVNDRWLVKNDRGRELGELVSALLRFRRYDENFSDIRSRLSAAVEVFEWLNGSRRPRVPEGGEHGTSEA